MIPKYAHSLGGKKMAIILRQRALDDYYKNPTLCKECGCVIEVGDRKVREVRKKKFCNRSCGAKYHNKTRLRKPKKLPRKRVRKDRSWGWLENCTKKQVFDKHVNWQSARSSIRVHAQFVYNSFNGGNRVCENCGYSKHIEVCHIKGVSEFGDDVLISVINNNDNLVGLCPNCHWEFDHNVLILRDRVTG